MQSQGVDKALFDPYASRYRQVLLAFFLRRVGDRVEAEDLVHDALLRLACKSPPVLHNPDAYVFQVAANLLRDRKRRERVRADYLALHWESERERVELRGPERVAASRELLSTLQIALRELPARTRNIFLLYRVERIKKTKIAALYRISTSAVDKHLMRAMAHIIRRTEDCR